MERGKKREKEERIQRKRFKNREITDRETQG